MTTPSPTSSPTQAPRHPDPLHSPTVQKHLDHLAQDWQARVADAITRFAGSMTFVYIHAVLFAVWMVFFEKSPWQTLTLIVSLEAIFLSTFVMIGQNRQTIFDRAKADHDFQTQEADLRHDLELTQSIHVLTTQMHARLMGGPTDESAPAGPSAPA